MELHRVNGMSPVRLIIAAIHKYILLQTVGPSAAFLCATMMSTKTMIGTLCSENETKNKISNTVDPCFLNAG
jgi:hypothetical protein